MRKLTLLITSLYASSLFAAPAGGFESFKNKTPFSILYSATQAKAFVGLIDDRGIGSYAECEVPASVGESITGTKELSRCVTVSGSTFIANELTVEAINNQFPIQLQRNFSAEFKKEDRERRDGAAGQMFFIFGAIVPGAISVGLWGGAMSAFTNNHRWLGTTRLLGSLGVGGVALGLGFMGVMGFLISDGETKVPSIESGVMNHYASLVAADPSLPVVSVSAQAWGLTYDLIRKSTLDSIRAVYSM